MAKAGDRVPGTMFCKIKRLIMGRRQEPDGWDTPKVKRRLPRLDRSDWLAIAVGFFTALLIIYLAGAK